MLKKQSLLIAIIYSIALATVSLIQFDLGSLSNLAPSFSDKIFHFIAYALMAFFWYNVFFYNNKFLKITTIIATLFITVAFGIIIEILQDKITYTRVFDTYDILANVLGTLFALIILSFKTKPDVK